ncbi:MAG: hypothetical protein HZC43_02325 [Nitrosomonadales bacterium]|nr:hypothetical protein [Nitrosomonadales bacterium]
MVSRLTPVISEMVCWDIYVAILEEKTDDFNRRYYQLQLEGSKTALELPGVLDEVVTLAILKADDGTTYRGFVTRADNTFGYTLTLQKIPPQRLPGWKPNEEQLKWVRPIADKLELPIPKPLVKIIKTYHGKHENPKLLGDLWNSRWGSNQEERFRRTIGKHTNT